MNKKPPRATLTLDLTEQMREVMELTVKLTVEETLAQYLEANPPEAGFPELFTLKEAADLLKVSISTLKKMRDAGDIATTNIGPAVRISSREILRFHGDI